MYKDIILYKDIIVHLTNVAKPYLSGKADLGLDLSAYSFQDGCS